LTRANIYHVKKKTGDIHIKDGNTSDSKKSGGNIHLKGMILLEKSQTLTF